MPPLGSSVGVSDLVAGREDGDPEFLVDRKLLKADRCRQADFLRPQLPPFFNDCRALADVFTGASAVGAFLDPRLDRHGAVRFDGVFLHDHRIGRFGHGSAGKDLKGFAARSRPLERMARRDPAVYRKLSGGVGIEVGVEDRVAVDGRVIVGRHIHWRHEVLG